jgi:nucleoside-diphosphate kinase
MRELTLAILKPDSVAAGNAGRILAYLEERGFVLRGLKVRRLRHAQAQEFYAVHRERSFYPSLVAFMTEGPVIIVALERENAVAHLRQVMGATDVSKAAEGTIRALYGTSIERNAIHGSDSPENAHREVSFFFATSELIAGH